MIGVLGSTGFLGINLCNKLRKLNIDHVGGSKSAKSVNSVDARSYDSLCNWVKYFNIDTIINLSANCGGIGLNKEHPFNLWYDNTLISAAVLKTSQTFKLKTVMLGTVCSYAAECPTPFKEEYLMNYGFPEPTNRAYGVTKLNGLVGAQALNIENGIDIINLIPVNMYGPHDNFDLKTSHVIPAIIRKLQDAKNNNLKYVEFWGDGSASREFLYVDDCCDAIIKSLDINNSEFINIGTGVEIQIKYLIKIINQIIKYEGDIKWLSGMPNGQMRRCLDISKAEKLLNWKPVIDLSTGLSKTIEWYLKSESYLERKFK